MRKILYPAAALVCGFVLAGCCCLKMECDSPDADAKAPLYIKVADGLEKEDIAQGESAKTRGKTTVAPAATVPLLSKVQKAYTAMPRKERIEYFADAKKRVEMQAAGYYPLTVKLETNCLSSAPHGHTYTISEYSSLAPAITVKCKDVKNQNLEIGNLKIAQKYYWTVRCELPGSSHPVSELRTFSTEDKVPRLLKIDGVPNVRDLGGYIGLNGKRVKQGMIYRTAGLNDNASMKYKPLAEVLKDPVLKAEKDERDAIVKACEAAIKADVPVKSVPYSISKNWIAYRPQQTAVTQADYEKFGKLTSIPQVFCGAKAENVTVNNQDCVVFPGKTGYQPSFFIQEFTAAEDGIMQIGIGGDWFYQVWVNGKKEFDLMRSGNFKYPITVQNHPIEIPVKKGKNIIAVPLLSGTASWTWCCGMPDKVRTHKRMLEKRIIQEKEVLATLLTIPDGRVAGKNRLNDTMKKYVVNDLGLKSDVDLRSDGECYGMDGSPAGHSVTWFHISSAAYAGMQSKPGKEAFAKVFKVFLDEENYPVCFHCIAGQDRTGSVAFILNGLLGVAEEDLYLDWEVTGFWNKNPNFDHKHRFNHLVAGFEKLPGKKLNEKIENYVLSLGFTKADIAKFRSIMLE